MTTNYTKSDEYRKVIHNLIPGGAHTYSKGDDQFPQNAPASFVRGKGCYVWDIDGNKFLDWTMGLYSVSLGHAYEPVLEAVIKELQNGSNFQRPSPVEREYAELFTSSIKGAEMVKYAKNGSTATTAAIKLSRAYTGRKMVARCKDHPFFSYDNWFIGDTLCNFGIPEEERRLTVNFAYNNIESVENLFSQYQGQIAALILEGTKFEEPKDDFLHKVQALCKKNGTVFILDEMINGFKAALGGCSEYYNLEPDMMTFGKGCANGFSVAVLTGKREIMELGGIRNKGSRRVFLVSTTHGGETHAIRAAITTLQEFKKHNVVKKFWDYGKRLKQATVEAIRSQGCEEYITVMGHDYFPGFIFRDHTGTDSAEFKTLFMQEMIKRGIFFQGFYSLCYMHSDEEIKITAETVAECCKIYKKAIDAGSVEGLLIGEAIKPVFREFN